jgi:hypothetical protein
MISIPKAPSALGDAPFFEGMQFVLSSPLIG